MGLKMTHDSLLPRGTRTRRVIFTGGMPVPPSYLLHSLSKLVVLIVAEIIDSAFARSGNRIPLLVELHPEVETHTTQDVPNLAERLLAEILGGEHFPLRALHQIANRLDAGVLQAIVRAN